MADLDFGQLLSEFASLGHDDRRAVERLLSPDERRRLKSYFDRRPLRELAEPPPPPARSAKLSIYSPWLAKRLAKIVNAPSNASDISPRALELVLRTLAETPGARTS